MTTKRKSGRLVLLLGMLLVVVIIVVGYILLTGGAQSLGGLGIAPPPPTSLPERSILVPKVDIAAGTYISLTLLADDFEVTTVTQTAELAGTDIITSRSQVQNMVAKDDLAAGQPMRQSQFIKAGLAFRVPQGKRAFPVEVDRYTGIVGRIAEKDHVDVILSGIMELYLPEEFPLCSMCELPNSCPQEICKKFPKTDIEPFRLLSAKTLIEDVEVLEVISLTVEAPAQKNVTPTPGPAGAPAGWILILAVDTQQAEVLKFAKDQGMSTQFLLRRRGDTGTLTTTGITTWILIDTYKMPRPRAIPYEIPAGVLPSGVIP